MVGWRDFDESMPNRGHFALAALEQHNKIGAVFDDRPEYYDSQERIDDVFAFGNGQNKIGIITQNVDELHQKAGSESVTELHGRTGRLKCMNCGAHMSRADFHSTLEDLNKDWLEDVLAERTKDDMRPDGDGEVKRDNYDDVLVPDCHECGVGFWKPDVVFFGDSVPKHRVERCKGAMTAADGLLCIGTSLAVHSAYRFVRMANELQVPIVVLNVGETRAETEGVAVLKIEAPIGATLSGCVDQFSAQTPTVPHR